MYLNIVDKCYRSKLPAVTYSAVAVPYSVATVVRSLWNSGLACSKEKKVVFFTSFVGKTSCQGPGQGSNSQMSIYPPSPVSTFQLPPQPTNTTVSYLRRKIADRRPSSVGRCNCAHMHLALRLAPVQVLGCVHPFRCTQFAQMLWRDL
jgi:hypothetical protein